MMIKANNSDSNQFEICGNQICKWAKNIKQIGVLQNLELSMQMEAISLTKCNKFDVNVSVNYVKY